MTNHDELRKLAEAATPGPWEFDGYQMISKDPSLNYGTRIVLDAEEGHVYSEYSSDAASLDVTPQNADFIAAANPSAVLALLDENARLRAQVGELKEALGPILGHDRGDEGQSDKHSFYIGINWGQMRRIRWAVHGKPHAKFDPDTSKLHGEAG